MSVYIKDMEMPKNCGECKFFAWKRGVGQHCAVDDRITFHATIDGMDVAYERNGNCPLVYIPSHGRLIDADALHFVRGFDEADPLDYIRRYSIEEAPTIIEAEGGEN